MQPFCLCVCCMVSSILKSVTGDYIKQFKSSSFANKNIVYNYDNVK
jgi:hypothetical protein